MMLEFCIHQTNSPVPGHRLPHIVELEERLKQLGLSAYLNVLVAQGFDTWETVLDITESDLWVIMP